MDGGGGRVDSAWEQDAKRLKVSLPKVAVAQGKMPKN